MRTFRLPFDKLEYYRNKKPIAVFTMSNWGGIEVLDIIHGIDDYVIARYNFGKPEKTIHNVKVRYTTAGTPYFRIGDDYIRLDECMKVS